MHQRQWFGLACIAMLASAAQAQEETKNIDIASHPSEFRQFDNVEITGSAIFRKEEKVSALPLEIITREDIRKSGATSVSQLIQGLTVMQNFLELGQMLSPVGGYSTAAIHGMQKGTLVLINGLRYAPYARQTNTSLERSGVDLNNLPLTAIDRIEILTDGASSLYGTDALAGVINIIMQEPRSGVTLQVDHVRPDGGHGQGITTSLTAGLGKLARDGYTLRITAEASHQDALRGADRPYASTGESAFVWNGIPYRSPGYYLSPARSPGTLFQPAASAFVNPAWSGALQATGRCPDRGVLVPQGDCWNNPYPQLDLYPSLDKQAAYLRGEAYLNANTIGHVELMMGQNTQRIRGEVFGSGQWQIATGSPFAPYVQQAGLQTPAFLLWSPSELPGPVTEFRHETSRIGTGIRGEWDAWNYHANLYQTESRSRWQYTRYLSLKAIQGLPLSRDMFSSLTGTPLASQLESMIGPQAIDHGLNRLQALEIRASRQLFEMTGGHAEWGSGLEWRREQVLFQDDRGLTGQAANLNQSRHDFSAYGELRLPVHTDFTITASARADRYDQFNTVNGKLAALWQPAPGWRLRASSGTGFHAPSLGQLNPQQVEIGKTANTLYFVCPTEVLAATGANCPKGFIPVYSAGSAQLQPEKSQQTTVGIHHDFSPHLSAGMDYWRVAMHNQISQANPRDILNDPLNHLNNFTRDADGYVALYTPLINIGRSLKSGLDLDARYRQVWDSTRLSLQAQATYYLSSWQQANPNDPVSSDLGKGAIESNSTTPRFKGRLMMGLAQSHWSGLITLNYQHSYVSMPVYAFNTLTQQSDLINDLKIPAYWTLDASFSHALQPWLDLRWGIKNMLNQKAPSTVVTEVPNLANTKTVYSDLWGRTLQLGMTARF